MSSRTRQQLEKWINSIKIPAQSKVLDIGGSQNPIQSRLGEKGEDTKYKILDLEVPHECKQEPNIVADIQEANWTHCSMTFDWEHNYFDVAFCIEVSEYWYNPMQALENIFEVLKHGGVLYISFHFIYPMHNPIKEDCLRYTRFGCIKLLEKAGFKIKEITSRVAENIDLNTIYAVEGMRPTKGFQGHSEEIGYLIKAVKI